MGLSRPHPGISAIREIRSEIVHTVVDFWPRNGKSIVVIPRHLTARITEALHDTPVVYLQGARQTGKSTLAQAIAAERGMDYLTLDTAAVFSAADWDPEGFVAGLEGPAVIDEVQRVPPFANRLQALHPPSLDVNRPPWSLAWEGATLVRVDGPPPTGRILAGNIRGDLTRSPLLDMLVGERYPGSTRMSVDIPAEFQQFVQSAVESGSFHNEAEVVGEALRLLQQRQSRLETLRSQIESAIGQLDRGEGIQLDDQSLEPFFEGIKSRGRERREAQQQGDP
jgi:putative addiction module CopG family antidote